MGFLDFLFDKDKAAARNIEKHKKKLTNMYVQASERQYIISALREIGTRDAALALVARFNEQAPNTTVDIEEKQFVYDVLVDMHRGTEVDIVGLLKEHLARSEEKINWPLKVLRDVLSRDEFIDVLVELLSTCTIGYQRTTEKKQELLLHAADLNDPKLHDEVSRFLEDSDEPVRFLAIETILKFDEPTLAGPLAQALIEEDSIRNTQKIVEEGLIAHREWIIPEELREDVDEALPEGFGVHKDGYVYRRRS